MFNKNKIKKIVVNSIVIISGILVLFIFFATYQKSKAASYDCNNLDASAVGSEIPRRCENQDVILNSGTFNADTIKTYQKAFVPPDSGGIPQPPVRVGTQCSDISDLNCDSIRIFKSLTLRNGAVLTHGQASVTNLDINRWRKVDLVINNNLTIEVGSAINVDGKGFQGGDNNHPSGYGFGGGTGVTLYNNSLNWGHIGAAGATWLGKGGQGYCDEPHCYLNLYNNNGSNEIDQKITQNIETKPYYMPSPEVFISDITNKVNNNNGLNDLFLFGSGGGNANKDRNASTDGTAGGGRIRIKADKIYTGSYNFISANGSDNWVIGSTRHRETAGGAGSGGTIIIDTPEIRTAYGSKSLINVVSNESVRGGIVPSNSSQSGSGKSGAFPFYGNSGKIFAPEGYPVFGTRINNYLISAKGGSTGMDLSVGDDNKPMYHGAGGGGLVVLKGLGSEGEWIPPTAKKVTSTIGWSDKTGPKTTQLSTIVWAKPVWQVISQVLESKIAPKPKFPEQFNYTARAYDQGTRICPFGDAIDFDFCYYYHDPLFDFHNSGSDLGGINRNFDDTVATDGVNLYVAGSRTGKVYRFNPRIELQAFANIGFELFDAPCPKCVGSGPGPYTVPSVRQVRRPISITTSKNSNSVYVLTSDTKANNYKIFKCTKEFNNTESDCTAYTLNINDFDSSLSGVNENVKMSIAFAENAVDNNGRLFLTANSKIGSWPPPHPLFITRLKLNDNNTNNTVSIDDNKIAHWENTNYTLIDNYAGGSGITVPRYGTSVGFATVGPDFICWWSGFDLSTSNRTCESSDVLGYALAISREYYQNLTSTLLAKSDPDQVMVPKGGSTYFYIGGGGITYYGEGVNF